MQPRHMVTRARNANAHPGLVDSTPKRPRAAGNTNTKKEAAEKKRVAKQQKLDTAVRKIADVEQRMAEQAALDVITPRADTHQFKSKKLRRTETYLQIPEDSSENDMPVDDLSESAASNGGESELTEPEAPPKKKKKIAPEGIRVSVKEYIAKEKDNVQQRPEHSGSTSLKDKGGAKPVETFDWELESEPEVSKLNESGQDRIITAEQPREIDKTPVKPAPVSKSKDAARAPADDDATTPRPSKTSKGASQSKKPTNLAEKGNPKAADQVSDGRRQGTDKTTRYVYSSFLFTCHHPC